MSSAVARVQTCSPHAQWTELSHVHVRFTVLPSRGVPPPVPASPLFHLLCAMFHPTRPQLPASNALPATCRCSMGMFMTPPPLLLPPSRRGSAHRSSSEGFTRSSPPHPACRKLLVSRMARVPRVSRLCQYLAITAHPMPPTSLQVQNCHRPQPRKTARRRLPTSCFM